MQRRQVQKNKRGGNNVCWLCVFTFRNKNSLPVRLMRSQRLRSQASRTLFLFFLRGQLRHDVCAPAKQNELYYVAHQIKCDITTEQSVPLAQLAPLLRRPPPAARALHEEPALVLLQQEERERAVGGGGKPSFDSFTTNCGSLRRSGYLNETMFLRHTNTNDFKTVSNLEELRQVVLSSFEQRKRSFSLWREGTEGQGALGQLRSRLLGGPGHVPLQGQKRLEAEGEVVVTDFFENEKIGRQAQFSRKSIGYRNRRAQSGSLPLRKDSCTEGCASSTSYYFCNKKAI